jgi:hypothetical protein
MCSFTLFSPIDIAFAKKKHGQHILEVLPIVCLDNGWYQPLRDMKKEGKILNIDFIAYNLYGTTLYKPKYAVVIRFL